MGRVPLGPLQTVLTPLLIIALIAISSWPIHATEAQYSLVEVKFPSPLYTTNTTLFDAVFQGPDPSPVAVFFDLQLPSETVTFQGSGWPGVHFSATIGDAEEGRHNYTFRIGSWTSLNRTVDVVNYFHLQFVNWEGHIENRLQEARSQNIDVRLAEARFELAKTYASQAAWQQAYNAALEANGLIDEAYITHRAGFDFFLWFTGGAVAFPAIVLFAHWSRQVRRRKRFLRARRAS